MEKIKSIIVAAALLVGVWLIGYIIGRNHIPDATGKIQIDTLVRHDTIRVDSPVEIRRIKTTDTLILPITDTLRVRDTVYLVLNRQIKEYRDSLFYARVSGYDPELDYIEVYPKTVVISKTETTIQDVTKRNAIALGLEANYFGSTHIPIYLEYSNMLHKNVGMYGRILYDLPTQSLGVGLGVKVCVGW